MHRQLNMRIYKAIRDVVGAWIEGLSWTIVKLS